MKQYIGTKTVKAKPMNRKEYNNLRGWKVPDDENPNDEGYLVEYVDSEANHIDFKSYISWYPKDVFEQVYKSSDTPIDRMQIELDELHERVKKLDELLSKPKPDFLTYEDWGLLHEQSSAMAKYYELLNIRLIIAKSRDYENG